MISSKPLAYVSSALNACQAFDILFVLYLPRNSGKENEAPGRKESQSKRYGYPFRAGGLSSNNHKTGEPVRARTEYFRKALYKACDAIGIPRRGLHALRRTYGSIVLDDGSISNKALTEQMGHADISTTYHYYAKRRKSNSKARLELSGIGAFRVLTNPKVV